MISKITAALRDADVGLPTRPHTPDSEGNGGEEWLTPYIRAVGRHRSGDVWIATATEVGHNVLVERMDEWLPKLSNGLRYSQPTYPVLIHGVPTSFDASRDSEDVNEQLIGDNIDTIMHPVALRSTKFLGGTHSQLHQKPHGSLVVHFSDPTIANACINLHITLNGELLPVVKFVCRPPCCFNCHHTGHFTHSCKNNRRCGLCAEDHDTRHCRSS